MLLNHGLRAASGNKIISTSYIGFTFQDRATETATDFTFTGVSLGSASNNRYIIVTTNLFSNTAGRTITSLTIAGNSASQVVQRSGDLTASGIWILYVPTGTTATIVASVSGTTNSVGIGVYAVFAKSLPIAFNTNNTGGTTSATRSVTLNAPTNSLIMGVSQSVNGANQTWTNITKTYGVDIRSGEWASAAADSNYVGNSSVSITSTSCRSLVVASFI